MSIKLWDNKNNNDALDHEWAPVPAAKAEAFVYHYFKKIYRAIILQWKQVLDCDF